MNTNYKYNHSLFDLHKLCINYIDETPEKNINQDIYECCFKYIRDVETKKEKNILINYFKIEL